VQKAGIEGATEHHAADKDATPRNLSKSRALRDPQAWRSRAEWARLAADQLADTAAKEHQLKLAESYERFARYAEERVLAEQRMQAGAGPDGTVP
jgi:hypothetical protein